MHMGYSGFSKPSTCPNDALVALTVQFGVISESQVTRSVETGPGKLSAQEKATIDAIVAARYVLFYIVC